MFILTAQKNKLIMNQRDPLTSGMVNTASVCFEFSTDWDGLTRTAVFEAGEERRVVVLDEDNACVIPWEVLTKPGISLMTGVYGTRGDEVVLPTVRTSLGTILQGVSSGGEAPGPPDPGPVTGVSDHRQLTHRDAERQHPISAIDGLLDVVNKIPGPTEALTNEELEALLK